MSLQGSVAQMRESFEAQFEATGTGRYVYRHNQKGEAIPVSAEEREGFIRQYVRRIRFVLGGFIATLLAGGAAVFWWMMSTNSDLPEAAMYVGMALITLIFVGLLYRAHGAPARELGRRTPVGGERSRNETRALNFKKLSYGQLAGAAAMGAILPFTLRSDTDVFHGWGRLWLVFGAALVLLAGIQAFRKWRFERENGDD